VPIVEVAHAPSFSEARLRDLASALPHAVSLAVECPEEPYDGHLKPGDVELVFRERSPHDGAGLDLLIHVRSKWFGSRAEDRDRRCARLRDVVVESVGPCSVGVYLSLPVAGWAQTD
jgi:hypothetical protein